MKSASARAISARVTSRQPRSTASLKAASIRRSYQAIPAGFGAPRGWLESTPEHWRFYEVFRHFPHAVIAQQIWYRYATGQTTNEAYAALGPAVGYLEARCRNLLAGVR